MHRSAKIYSKFQIQGENWVREPCEDLYYKNSQVLFITLQNFSCRYQPKENQDPGIFP